MTQIKFIMPVLIGTVTLFTVACSAGTAVPQPGAVQTNPNIVPQAEIAQEAQETIAIEGQPEIEADIEADVERNSALAAESVEADSMTEKVDAENINITAESVPFNAVIGLDTFSAYRLNYDATFNGMRNGQPTAGMLGGLFEVTRNPDAQHWQVNMDGDMFSQFTALGSNMIELYDLGNTVYVQNPQDGGFISMPAFVVKSLLPTDIYTPEDNISLPLTAVPQPGVEMINGVATQRYTFNSSDLTAEDSSNKDVNGTIWVAVNGNYVVKYEATITGQFEDMVTAGVELLDEGTVSLVYNLADVNGDFTIAAPAGATSIDLGKLFLN